MASRDPLAGPLHIGAIPTRSPYLMPLILNAAEKKHPQLRLILSEEMTDSLIKRLHNHEIDAALLAMPVDEQDFVNVSLFDEPCWVAYPRQYHFYDRGKITLRVLGNENLLLLFEAHCLAKQAMDLCHIGGLAQQGEMAGLRAASLEKLIQLVHAGSGVTLLPALAMQGSWGHR